LGTAHADVDQAARHFDRALSLAGEGRLEAAAGEFERAYAVRQHYSVLYNLAQVYGRLGRHLDAIAAYERHLEQGGNALEPQRHARVRELIVAQHRQLASLKLVTVPQGAKVDFDAPATQRADGGWLVDPKPYEITVSLEGYSSHTQRVVFLPGKEEQLRIVLEPRSRGFSLDILCPLPDVVLSVDGKPIRTLPGRPARVVQQIETRTLEVTFSRDGYFSHSVKLPPEGASAKLACALVPDPAKKDELASLTVRVSEPSAQISVDGEAFRGQPLVPGRHLVTAERDGFHPWSRLVAVNHGSATTLRITLTPTEDYRRQHQTDAHRRRAYAYGIGAAGLASAAAGGAIYAWGFHRANIYERRYAEIVGPGGAGLGSAEDRDNEALRRSIVLYDYVALGLGVQGGLALGAALWLYVGGDDPNRYQTANGWSVRLSPSGMSAERRF
jgi:hypothetical protein